MSDHLSFRLRNTGFGWRLGLSGLVLVFFIGLAASLAHLMWHYEKRDDVPGLTRDDIVAAYAGLDAPSPLLSALKAGHPQDAKLLAKDQQEALIKWLSGDRIRENFDNIDFAPASPQEIMAQSCVQCHGRAVAAEKGKNLVLDGWQSLDKIAFSRKVERTPDKVKVISTHAHALSMATMSVAILGMAFFTRWPRGLLGLLAALSGLGLLADIASWWLASRHETFVNTILAGGATYAAATGLLLLLILVDLWWPKPR